MTKTMGSQAWNQLARTSRVAMLIAGVATFSTATALAQASLSESQVASIVLRALAGAANLANEAITTQTVYGTVTLSGTVRDESMRREAETLASRADGVKKVIDELQLGVGSGEVPAAAATAQTQLPANQALNPTSENQAAAGQPPQLFCSRMEPMPQPIPGLRLRARLPRRRLSAIIPRRIRR